MQHVDEQLLNLYHRIRTHGEERNAERTGVGTVSLFGERIQVDLNDGFPAITTKKLAFNAMKAELLWFIEGSGDERRLAEILTGSRDDSVKTIWSGNAEFPNAPFIPGFKGDLGRIYGKQWRSWSATKILSYEDYSMHSGECTTYFGAKAQRKEIDQLAVAIKLLKENPQSRRIIISAWNPGELDQMALPPCHLFAQFYLSNNNKLSCQMYQRSVDSFLGLPFNIASYALLTHLIAKEIGSGVGKLTLCLGDTHLYKNHIPAVKEQMTRNKFKLPKLVLTNDNILTATMDDITLENYVCHPSISAPMAV